MSEAEASLTPATPLAGSTISRNPFATVKYRWYWAAVVCGGMGVGIQIVTIPLFIRDRVGADHRELIIAAALIAQTVPAALLMLLGGVAADRFSRNRIMIRVWMTASLVSVTYVFLTAAGFHHIWPVFILGAVVGSLDAFGQPARQSMAPQILPREQIQNGFILNTVAFMSAFQFLGPTIGGFLADFFNLSVAFSAEVIFLLIGALLATRVRAPKPEPTGKSVFADLGDGLAYVAHRKTIIALLMLQLLPGLLLIGPFRVTAVGMVEDVLHASDRYVGLLSGFFGAGVILGSVALTFVRIRRRGLLLCAAPIFGGAVLLAYGLSEQLALSLALMLPWGLSAAIFINMVTPLIQEQTEPQMLGRVMSMSSLAFAIATPLGFLQSGLIANFWGPQEALIFSGVVITVIGVLAVLLLQPVKRLR